MFSSSYLKLDYLLWLDPVGLLSLSLNVVIGCNAVATPKCIIFWWSE